MTACRHNFLPSDRVPQYAFCAACDTYKSLLPATPEDYWQGTESLYKQAWNVDMHTEGGISKNAFVLKRLACGRDSALEIGCAPGRMLYWLRWAADFEHIVGIDVADKWIIDRISCSSAGWVHAGLFPDMVPSGQANFDLIMGLDVFEHSDKPERFLDECYRLMKPNGQLLLMLPLADDLPTDSRFFNASEHVYLHSQRNMAAMVEDAGFREVEFSQWCPGHDLVSARKR